jgi:hypothetical protein
MRIIIRAVPERAEFIEYLKNHLPDAEWCMDKKRDAMDTFVRAMEMAGDDACLHMEEDIILTERFLAKVSVAVANHPDKVIQFFSMRKADCTLGSRYDSSFIMGQCFYLPAGYSALIADYKQYWPDLKEHPTGVDMMVNDFLRVRKEKYWIHVPSLVEHRVTKSMIDPRRSSKRQSKTFVEPLL